MRFADFDFQCLFSVFTVAVTLWLMSPIAIFGQMQVEVEVTEQKLISSTGYEYRFSVQNVADTDVDLFEVVYSGSQPTAHAEPHSWTYSVEGESEGITLQNVVWSYRAENRGIGRDKILAFHLILSEQLTKIDWHTTNRSFFVSAGGSIAIHPPDTEFNTSVTLTKGIHMVSLPLKPQQPFTASSLANTLGSTIVIRVADGRFDAYVHEGEVGTDFPIEMGKGYIINLLEAKSFELIGTPWGVPTAPSEHWVQTQKPLLTEPWAFVVTGHITGALPVGTTAYITNARTGQAIPAPVESNGRFIGAFVDLNRHAVIASGDTLTVNLLDKSGYPLREPQYSQLMPTHMERAHLQMTLAGSPRRTRLLQNFPNPFNPETWIPYTLAEASEVTIRIYDIHGREVRSFVLGLQQAGWYRTRSSAVYWDGRNAAGERVGSGIYFYAVDAGSFRATRRLVVTK